jgi:hypothetical protein
VPPNAKLEVHYVMFSVLSVILQEGSNLVVVQIEVSLPWRITNF